MTFQFTCTFPYLIEWFHAAGRENIISPFCQACNMHETCPFVSRENFIARPRNKQSVCWAFLLRSLLEKFPFRYVTYFFYGDAYYKYVSKFESFCWRQSQHGGGRVCSLVVTRASVASEVLDSTPHESEYSEI